MGLGLDSAASGEGGGGGSAMLDAEMRDSAESSGAAGDFRSRMLAISSVVDESAELNELAKLDSKIVVVTDEYGVADDICEEFLPGLPAVTPPIMKELL